MTLSTRPPSACAASDRPCSGEVRVCCVCCVCWGGGGWVGGSHRMGRVLLFSRSSRLLFPSQ